MGGSETDSPLLEERDPLGEVDEADSSSSISVSVGLSTKARPVMCASGTSCAGDST